MHTVRNNIFVLLISLLIIYGIFSGCADISFASENFSWWDESRARRVAENIIPGRNIPDWTPDNLFKEWTAAQVERWHRDNPETDPGEAYRRYSSAEPADEELRKDFPRHISPFARVRSGHVPEGLESVRPAKYSGLINYCPFCREQKPSCNRTASMPILEFDDNNPRFARTVCCGTELFGREEDYPENYELAPTEIVEFQKLDGSVLQVPCTIYIDDETGVEWELFMDVIFDYRRWGEVSHHLMRRYARAFAETADPFYAHKLAVILDEVASTYYGLSPAHRNRIAKGRDGKPLTREEWEQVPRPAVFEHSYLGPWHRRMRRFTHKGWNLHLEETIWAQPFARVRHHPAFRHYSKIRYGDPDYLDLKIRKKLMRETSLTIQSVNSQRFIHNYQSPESIDLWLTGILAEDEVLIDFAGPVQEVTMYNTTYQDGLISQGAPNYMRMPARTFYPVLAGETTRHLTGEGWLEHHPAFLEDNPFYWTVAGDDWSRVYTEHRWEDAGEWRKLSTVRGLPLEFGDQHIHAYPEFWPNAVHGVGFFRDEQVKTRERLGSRNWPGYGAGILRAGSPGRRMEVSMLYTRQSNHLAQDALSLECWVDGVPVMRRPGYSTSSRHARLTSKDKDALNELGYPARIMEGGLHRDWDWDYVHSPVAQNTAMVNDTAPGMGWGRERGYGEVITFKGGEVAGKPGSRFQVLDVLDHNSYAAGSGHPEDRGVTDYRRTLIAVEGPDGRPYVIDIKKLAGGASHTLYNSAWAERGRENMPEMKREAHTLGELFFCQEYPAPSSTADYFDNVQRVKLLERPGPGDTWSLTWKADLARYAPRPAYGSEYTRPLPDDDGRVRLRMIGLTDADAQTRLLQGKGPFIAWIKQELPHGASIDGNVVFMDDRDFLIERRESGDGSDLKSMFIHVLEGFPEGEESAIKSVERMAAVNAGGKDRDIAVLRLEMEGGHSDTVIYQSQSGRVVLPGDFDTDARYALLRRDSEGEVVAADVVRGTYLKAECSAADFEVRMQAEFTGTIVDLAGDLTGTRRESAVIIQPDNDWPEGKVLHDKQLLVRVESSLRDDCSEGYRIDSVTGIPGGLLRVDLQDYAPFGVSWHNVAELPADRPRVIKTNRAMSLHSHGGWLRGINIWFPEHDQTFTIKNASPIRNPLILEVVEDVNLAGEGVGVGDWYVIYRIRPGFRVLVPGDMSWEKDSNILHATGPAGLN